MKTRDEVLAEEDAKTPEERRPVQTAADGVGPLYQRDYTLDVEGCESSPEEAVAILRREFPRFSPDLLVPFSRPEGAEGPLAVGDTMHVLIRGAGHAGVVVTHLDARSMTLRTQEGHMEAGRITFGAYRDRSGRLILRIRSRARIRDPFRYAAYELVGKQAQAAIWITFLQRWAEACGGAASKEVAVETETVEDRPADLGEEEVPTFSPFESPWS